MKDTYLKKILGGKCFNKIQSARVLMVGAGGLGCELLKDLVLSGYGEIHIVDLDTITLSNLNRQFLFRKTDIDKSKSLTVAKAVESFNYLGAKLVPHHGNVMDTKQFPLEWWQQFDYIFNALDNIEARRYVNSMCLLLKKPLMESGTEGYNGHVCPILPYYSACFDCQAHVAPKTYPVCTIRSTPSLPVHCITWAKEFLFYQLFDEVEDSGLNDSEAISKETDNDAEIENLAKEANELAELRAMIVNSDKDTFFRELVNKIFRVDIERLLQIDALWQTRRKPTPLHLEEYKLDVSDLSETKNWTIAENLYALYVSSANIQQRLKEEQYVAFDKDDDDTMTFVAAASNLRSFVFHIETKSKFDIKEIAGNIIPAIATTNAFISGFASAIGTQYFKHEKATLENTHLLHTSSAAKHAVVSAPIGPPNPECPSCSAYRGVLHVSRHDFDSLTLQWLVDQLVPLYKSDISIQVGQSKLIYDVDFDDYALDKLSQVPDFKNGETILVQDDSNRLDNLILYLAVGNETRFPPVKLKEKPVKEESDLDGSDDDGFELIEGDNSSDVEIIEEPPLKRKRV
ncbi:UBA2 [Candida margitis]|uniref:UBA2 n=1 Tax=Candida margitis TaxID=1775924 RepID=UPI002227AB80|nr:UBA2 [Candida margitis]KAI5968714.1 UBA2 [Candida margitis]